MSKHDKQPPKTATASGPVGAPADGSTAKRKLQQAARLLAKGAIRLVVAQSEGHEDDKPAVDSNSTQTHDEERDTQP